eukprot:g28929.t1
MAGGGIRRFCVVPYLLGRGLQVTALIDERGLWTIMLAGRHKLACDHTGFGEGDVGEVGNITGVMRLEKQAATLDGWEGMLWKWALINLSRFLLGKWLFEKVMTMTFYGQFVAGKDQDDIKPLIQHYRSFGVGSILDYSVEEDLTQEEAEKKEM